MKSHKASEVSFDSSRAAFFVCLFAASSAGVALLAGCETGKAGGVPPGIVDPPADDEPQTPPEADDDDPQPDEGE